MAVNRPLKREKVSDPSAKLAAKHANSLSYGVHRRVGLADYLSNKRFAWVCNQEYLVIGYHPKPFCFHCNTSVDAWHCVDCGRSHMVDVTSCPLLADES